MPEVEVVLDDIEHARHLREDEGTVASRVAVLEQTIQHHQLAARLKQGRSTNN